MRKATALLLSVGFLLAFPLVAVGQPTIDGDLTDSEYTIVANPDDADGFGGGADVDSLLYHVDVNQGEVYVAVAGRLGPEIVFDDINNIGIWINVTGGDSSPSGLPAGDTLGLKIDQDHRYLTGNFADAEEPDNNTNFTADFEVDFMTAVGPTFNNPASDAIAVVGNHTTDPSSIVPFDTTDQSGTSATDTEGLGIEYAFLNSDDETTGVEWKIPFDAIGATSSNSIEVFAFGVSSTAFFSNEVIPGNASNLDNPGTDPQWDVVADTTGETWHTQPIALPVELASFDARRDGESAVLSWQTASETNNTGFTIQHAVGTEGFEQIGWVDGVGTTTEAQTYNFTAENLSAGPHRFRLKQEDLDGTTSFSDVVEVAVRPAGPIAVEQVAPNPVRQTSTVEFTLRETGSVSVGLYDVLGRQVRTLHEGRVSGNQPQQVSVDAASLSSGVYFLRVKGDGFTKTQRITVTQ